MYLYLVKRVDDADYDEYDGAVLRAKTKDRALEIATGMNSDDMPRYEGFRRDGSNLTVACIGAADARNEYEGEVLSSFNAG